MPPTFESQSLSQNPSGDAWRRPHLPNHHQFIPNFSNRQTVPNQYFEQETPNQYFEQDTSNQNFDQFALSKNFDQCASSRVIDPNFLNKHVPSRHFEGDISSRHFEGDISNRRSGPNQYLEQDISKRHSGPSASYRQLESNARSDVLNPWFPSDRQSNQNQVWDNEDKMGFLNPELFQPQPSNFSNRDGPGSNHLQSNPFTKQGQFMPNIRPSSERNRTHHAGNDFTYCGDLNCEHLNSVKI